MKNIKIITTLFIVFLSAHLLKAQDESTKLDTLWYLNGDYELISNYTFVEEGYTLNYSNQKGKLKDVEAFSLYSINKADGTKIQVYQPTMEEEGDTLTVEEMQSFVIGGYFGSSKYKAPWATAEGFIVGAASPFAVAAAGLNPLLSIVIPAGNSSIVGLTNPSMKKIQKNYPQWSKDPVFVEGFKEAAKRKRIKNSIKGGILGMVLGIATVFIISAN